MHLEILVEEASAEAALQHILPKILGPAIEFRIHSHQGKSDLLQKLPARLRGYQTWLPNDWRIVVLVDADEQDCRVLKTQLETSAQQSGLLTKSAVAPASRFQVLNRLAIEELEAWFLGDVEALRTVYPRVSPNLAHKARYRDPDDVRGGTWEALERELQRFGYHKTGLPKIQVAREIAEHMVPERNHSRSFQVFRQGLLDLVTRE